MPLPETSSLEDSLARILGQPATTASPAAQPATSSINYGGLGSPGNLSNTVSLGAEQPYTDPAAAAASTATPAAAVPAATSWADSEAAMRAAGLPESHITAAKKGYDMSAAISALPQNDDPMAYHQSVVGIVSGKGTSPGATSGMTEQEYIASQLGGYDWRGKASQASMARDNYYGGPMSSESAYIASKLGGYDWRGKGPQASALAAEYHAIPKK